MGDRFIFDCPKCGDGEVYFYTDMETSKCDNCGTNWRMMITLEEVESLDQR